MEQALEIGRSMGFSARRWEENMMQAEGGGPRPWKGQCESHISALLFSVIRERSLSQKGGGKSRGCN